MQSSQRCTRVSTGTFRFRCSCSQQRQQTTITSYTRIGFGSCWRRRCCCYCTKTVKLECTSFEHASILSYCFVCSSQGSRSLRQDVRRLACKTGLSSCCARASMHLGASGVTYACLRRLSAREVHSSEMQILSRCSRAASAPASSLGCIPVCCCSCFGCCFKPSCCPGCHCISAGWLSFYCCSCCVICCSAWSGHPRCSLSSLRCSGSRCWRKSQRRIQAQHPGELETRVTCDTHSSCCSYTEVVTEEARSTVTGASGVKGSK